MGIAGRQRLREGGLDQGGDFGGWPVIPRSGLRPTDRGQRERRVGSNRATVMLERIREMEPAERVLCDEELRNRGRLAVQPVVEAATATTRNQPGHSCGNSAFTSSDRRLDSGRI